ncbi:MAG: peptidylprolyl isomerase [Pseudomonadota bacterium]
MTMTFAKSRRLLTSGLASLCLSVAALPVLAQQAETPTPSPTSHSIAAVVNNDIITSHDLRQRVLFMLATTGVERNEETLRRVQAQALRNLIDEHLQMQEAEKYDQTIDDREVNQNVARLIGRNGLDPQEVVQRLAAVGVSIETLRDQVRSEIAWQRIINGLFGSRIRISDTVIEETLARISADANEPSFRLAEIYIEATPEIGGPSGARDGAQAMIDQLGQGAPFPLLAQQFSSAPSAAAGGDMGWMKAGDLRPQIAAVLPELDPGEVSEPIIVPGGAYVVALLEKRVSEVDTLFRLSQVRVEAESFEDANARLDAIRPTLSSCDTLDEAVADLDGVSTASMGELKASELSEEIQVRLQDVQVGELSDAFAGPTGAAAIMVCKRETTGSEIPTRDAIENRLMDTQLAQASRRHLRDLRRKATISVRG